MSQTTASLKKLERLSNSQEDASWDKDLLNRKPYADNLELLIANSPGPYVLGLTSPWGSGKTFFLDAWHRDLLQRQLPCVYFNAWKEDHAENSLLVLVNNVFTQLQDQGIIFHSPKKTIIEKLNKLIESSPRALGKLVAGIINHYTNDALDETVEQIVSNSIELSASSFAKRNKAREDFKERLKKTAQHIKSTYKFPLFIMIDELDRCRPSYTISLLESIKHLFNVEGVIFLLSIDPNQLFCTIEHTFGLKKENGSQLDPRQDYLKKFIDLFWRLPLPQNNMFLFSVLKDRQVPVPQGWHTDNQAFWKSVNANPGQTLLEENSYYFILSMAAHTAQLSLRAYIQIIEKFIAISYAYKLEWREAFLIFDTLIHKISDTDDSNFNPNIRQATYRANTATNIDVESVNNLPIDIYNCIKAHIMNQCNCTLRFNGQLAQTQNAAWGFISKMATDFNSHKLYESVHKKIKFLSPFE